MHPEVNYCINADTTFDKLILQRKAVTKGLNKKPSISIDTLTYNKNEIRSMTIKEINGGQTALLVIGIITAAALIAYLIALSTFKLDLSGMKLFEGQRF
jgi:membrane-bound inhibitor of C-type lysozyme